MRRLIFPYGIRFQEDGQVDVFPAVEVSVVGRGRKGIRALFHLDSGATTTIMPASDTEVLGITLASGKKIIVRGISSEALLGYRHTVMLQFGSIKIKTPVIFTTTATVPRILGREVIFHRFSILFDEAKRRTLFLDSQKERKIINALFQKLST